MFRVGHDVVSKIKRPIRYSGTTTKKKTVHEMPKPEDPTLQHCKSAVQNIPRVYLVPGCILVENHSQNYFEITSESARVLIVRSEKRTEKKENPHGHVQVNLRRTCPKLMSNI